MKKVAIAFSMCLAIACLSWSGDLDGQVYVNDPWTLYRFEDNSLVSEIIDAITGEETKTRYSYELFEKNKVPFIRLKSGSSVEEWLCLYSEDILLMQNPRRDKRRTMGGFRPTTANREELFSLIRNDVSASSFLIEDKTEYRPSNLGITDPDKPWVEGVPGYGIGEKIIFRDINVRNMYWSNGYVSYERAYLYERNSRVKQIRITDESTGEKRVVDLEDTPNPQKISFGNNRPMKVRTITIEILDVYKGTHYDDTCVNFIMVES